MKRLTTIFLLFFAVTLTAQETTFKQFYKANKKQAEVSLNIPGFLARMFIDDEDIEHEKLLKEANSFRVLVFDKDQNKIASKFKKFTKSNKLKTLVRVKDGQDRAEIYYREKNNYIREIIISAGSKNDEFVLLGLKTKITQDELASILSDAKNKTASK